MAWAPGQIIQQFALDGFQRFRSETTRVAGMQDAKGQQELLGSPPRTTADLSRLRLHRTEEELKKSFTLQH